MKLKVIFISEKQQFVFGVGQVAFREVVLHLQLPIVLRHQGFERGSSQGQVPEILEEVESAQERLHCESGYFQRRQKHLETFRF